MRLRLFAIDFVYNGKEVTHWMFATSAEHTAEFISDTLDVDDNDISSVYFPADEDHQIPFKMSEITIRMSIKEWEAIFSQITESELIYIGAMSVDDEDDDIQA